MLFVGRGETLGIHFLAILHCTALAFDGHVCYQLLLAMSCHTHCTPAGLDTWFGFRLFFRSNWLNVRHTLLVDLKLWEPTVGFGFTWSFVALNCSRSIAQFWSFTSCESSTHCFPLDSNWENGKLVFTFPWWPILNSTHSSLVYRHLLVAEFFMRFAIIHYQLWWFPLITQLGFPPKGTVHGKKILPTNY